MCVCECAGVWLCSVLGVFFVLLSFDVDMIFSKTKPGNDLDPVLDIGTCMQNLPLAVALAGFYQKNVDLICCINVALCP